MPVISGRNIEDKWDACFKPTPREIPLPVYDSCLVGRPNKSFGSETLNPKDRMLHFQKRSRSFRTRFVNDAMGICAGRKGINEEPDPDAAIGAAGFFIHILSYRIESGGKCSVISRSKQI